MKKLILSASFIGLAVLSSCGAKVDMDVEVSTSTDEVKAEEQDKTVYKNVNTTEFAKLATEGNGLLLDVRTDEEYEAGHIEGAKQIDYYGDDFDAEVDKLDKNTPVYVYCRSGGRSGKTMEMMKDKGFTKVYNLDGGMLAWEKAGEPVEKGSDE